MLNNLTNYSNLISNGKIRTLLDATDLFTIGVRDLNFIGNYQPALITSTNLANSIASLLPFPFTLTTTGTSGASTLIGTVLNIPNYTSTGVASVTGLDTDNTDPLNPIVNIAVDGVTVTGDGTSGNPLVSVASGVVSVTGLDTDNTDPLNPIVQISVDGTTITGDGTPGNPLIGSGGSLPAWLEYNATDLTIWNNGQGNVVNNTSFGDLALAINSTGSNNTAIGYNTLYNNQGGTQNTAIGSNALSGNISSNFNTGIGYGALFTNGSTDYNTAIGASALYFNYGQQNTAIGALALQNNTGGQRNTAVGYSSLKTNSTGINNVSSGAFSLFSNTTGNNNVSSGYQSLVNNTSGITNTAIGHQSLAFNSTGSNNIAIGGTALYSHTTGSDNTAIGYGTVSGNFSSSVILGKSATATASNQFVVGSPSYNAGTIATEALVLTESWTVKINGVNYKIPLQIA